MVAESGAARSTPQIGVGVGFDTLLRVGGVALVLSALVSALGGIWDIQWHEDVGPDTFFTAPHLFLYAGAIGAGLTALAVVLVGTALKLSGEAGADGSLVPLLGRRFWAPVGFVVAGCGSLLFLLFGLFDLWWHSVYGFDAVLDSPPHTGLGLADLVTLCGGMTVGALLVVRRRQTGGVRLGSLPPAVLATAVAVFLVNSASWQTGFEEPIAGVPAGQMLFVAALFSLALLAVASVVRVAGAATLTAVIFALVCAGGWLFSAWATPLYAGAVGLSLRDDAFGFPRIVALLPDFVLPAALGVDAVLAVARRRGWPVRGGVMAAGGAGMAVLAAFELAVPNGPFLERLPVGTALVVVLAAAGLGAAFGWVGWNLGVVLRRLGGDEGGGRPAGSPNPAARTRAGRAAVAAGALLLALPMATAAVEPVAVVHRESVRVGPYPIEVGFSEWPIRAERSLDILFAAADGVADKTGTVTLIAPSGAEFEERLVRHPRAREAWGLDIVALPESGRWSFRFAIDGPEGAGIGRLSVTLGERPGPPVLVGWLPALAVSAAMVGTLAVAWRRARPAAAPETWAWT